MKYTSKCLINFEARLIYTSRVGIFFGIIHLLHPSILVVNIILKFSYFILCIEKRDNIFSVAQLFILSCAINMKSNVTGQQMPLRTFKLLWKCIKDLRKAKKLFVYEIRVVKYTRSRYFGVSFGAEFSFLVVNKAKHNQDQKRDHYHLYIKW